MPTCEKPFRRFFCQANAHPCNRRRYNWFLGEINIRANRLPFYLTSFLALLIKYIPLFLQELLPFLFTFAPIKRRMRMELSYVIHNDEQTERNYDEIKATI